MDPLAGLPSILAIRDLRRRIRRHFADPLTPGQVLALLRLDPPSVLRALRAACAPVYGRSREWLTIDDLGATLGSSLSRRVLDVPAIDITGTAPARRLWLHSVATARAAEILAVSTGLMPPEHAYIGGLLHDLPLWLEFLGRRRTGMPPPGTVGEWTRHWNVPVRLAELLEEVVAIQAQKPTAPQPTSPATLICAAELLAELADFTHPPAADAVDRDRLLDSVGRSDFMAAQRLRREVEHDLLDVGLDLATPEPALDPDRLEFQDETDWLQHRPRTETVEIVLSVLGCSKSATCRGITTATTSAALRYLGYDRAFYVKWVRETGALAVRAKADLSARRLRTTVVMPTAQERDELATALQLERPVRLASVRDGGDGLLSFLGVDEAIAVAVNREFATPSFLVLDRAVSARPLQLLRETDMVSALAITASMLNENLLLKRRRQRAQKFALTDPLTRLFNRRFGISHLDQEIARNQRSGGALTILMIDLDDFKRLNDRFGHLQGDHALRATAEVLRKTLRKVDTICRYGGEEFLVVLPQTSAEDAAILAARLFVAVEARGVELQLPVTVSIGQATLRPWDTAESLLQRADQALYASKSQGRNRFSVDADLD
jgi:diguanylate cyclase (GGDEF)-like protein